MGQPQHGELGRAVSRPGRAGLLGCVGGDVDDAPAVARFNHPAAHFLGEQVGRGGVNAQEMLPHVLFQLGYRYLVPADDGAGVVHQDVNAPVVAHNLLDHSLDLGAVAQVAVYRESAAADGSHFLGNRVNAAPTVAHFGGRQVFRLAVNVGQSDVCAHARQLHHRGPAHAAHPARAGNQRHLAFQSCHFNSPRFAVLI